METYSYNYDGWVVRGSDGAVISEDSTTLARQELNEWVSEGNTINPYVEGA